MFERYCGLETEYAIRFSGTNKPDNREIYDRLIDSIRGLVSVQPGSLFIKWNQVFLGSGGSLCYEMLPHHPGGGLVEAATPEDTDPAKVILYQRAQEFLLQKAIPRCEKKLRESGYSGELSLIKNCRDALGNIYGAQENYSTTAANGFHLWLFRVFIALLIPLFLSFGFVAIAITVIATIFQLIYFMAVSVVAGFSGLIGFILPFYKYTPLYHYIENLRDLYFFTNGSKVRGVEKWTGRFLYVLELSISWPIFLTVGLIVRLTLFRKHRKELTAFLITRAIFTGTGSLIDSDDFRLSEKAWSVNRIMRTSVLPQEHAIFDIGNIMKSIQMATLRMLAFDFSEWKSVFSSVQRLQIGISDSNMAQTSEYLKLSVTKMLIDICENGGLKDTVKVKRPVKCMRLLNRKVIENLNWKFKVHYQGKNREMSAVEVQRVYLEAAKEFMAKNTAIALESKTVIETWESVLNSLEKNPAELFGRVDWVTKKTLLQEASNLTFEAKKKIDLKYHELGTGYFQQLESQKLVPVLFQDHDIEQAAYYGPSEGRSAFRAAIIRKLKYETSPVSVSWDKIKVGGPFQSKVIDLNRYRDRKSNQSDSFS